MWRFWLTLLHRLFGTGIDTYAEFKPMFDERARAKKEKEDLEAKRVVDVPYTEVKTPNGHERQGG